jgi:hypothetical protein
MQYIDINQYRRTISLIDEILAQHPKFFDQLNPTERDMLSQYYFAGRSVDVDDIEEYRTKLIQRSPEIELVANKAFDRLLAVAGVPETVHPGYN